MYSVWGYKSQNIFFPSPWLAILVMPCIQPHRSCNGCQHPFAPFNDLKIRPQKNKIKHFLGVLNFFTTKVEHSRVMRCMFKILNN